MPVTINGTTGIDVVTTSAVLTATAGAFVGGVGTYALCRFITSTAISAGSTTSGSNLRYAGATIGLSNTGTQLRTGTNGTTGLSGTWQAMGQHTPVSPDFPFMLWLRIS
jgi:hypothetical protein